MPWSAAGGSGALARELGRLRRRPGPRPRFRRALSAAPSQRAHPARSLALDGRALASCRPARPPAHSGAARTRPRDHGDHARREGAASRPSSASACARIAWWRCRRPRRHWFRPGGSRSPAPPYFLFVGTLEPRKNLETLLEAWREVRRNHAVDLVLAGRPPRRCSRHSGRSPDCGWRAKSPDSELPALYSGALAFVYPSLYEGFGLPVLEAMQCGAPVIASRAVEEAAGDAAIYADTARDLASAMAELASRPECGRSGARAFPGARRANSPGNGPPGLPVKSTRRREPALEREVTTSPPPLFLAPEAPYPIGRWRRSALGFAAGVSGAPLRRGCDRLPPTGSARSRRPDPAPAGSQRHGARSARATGAASRPGRCAMRDGWCGVCRRWWIASRVSAAIAARGRRTPLRPRRDRALLVRAVPGADLAGLHADRARPAQCRERASRTLRRDGRRRHGCCPSRLPEAFRRNWSAPGCRAFRWCSPRRRPMPSLSAPSRRTPRLRSTRTPFRATPLPAAGDEEAIVFSGNMEYHPNLTAVRFFRREIWPQLRERWPRLVWRLVGKNPAAVRRFTAAIRESKCAGPVARRCA